jgi:hypothetical protein
LPQSRSKIQIVNTLPTLALCSDLCNVCDDEIADEGAQMNEAESQPFDDREKVRILLHEYTALRQEILQRTTHGFTIFAVGGTIFVWAVSGPFNQLPWVLIGLATIAVLIAARVTFNAIEEAAMRVQDIERTINQLVGEELLIWELKKAPLVHGSKWIWRNAKYGAEATARTSSEKPPQENIPNNP